MRRKLKEFREIHYGPDMRSTTPEEELTRTGTLGGYSEMTIVGAEQLSTHRDEYRRVILSDNPPRLHMRVPQMDFIDCISPEGVRLHPLSCGIIVAKLLKDVGCTKGSISMSFDVMMDDLELWDIPSCRMFCYGFASEGGIGMIDKERYNGPSKLRAGGIKAVVGCMVEALAITSSIMGDIRRVSPTPPRLPVLNSVMSGKGEILRALKESYLSRGH